MNRLTCVLAVILACVFALITFNRSWAQEAATAPATTQAQLHISPEAAPVLDEMKKAYVNLKSLELVGSIKGEFDVDGQEDNQQVDFVASYQAPNKFKHDVLKSSIVGSTGEKVYALARERNTFMTADAPKGKTMLNELPEPIGPLVGGQNLSLVLAMSSDPLKEITSNYPTIEKIADEKIDDKSYTTLKLSEADGKRAVRLLVDPQTHFVRRLIADLSGELRERKAENVKKAQVTVDYTTTTPDAPVKSDQFAFTPPAGAKDAKDMAMGEESEADKLLGKPASDFKLTSLDGKEVSLASLKGKVVVLDFGATWCPPCVMLSMPDLQELHDQYKDDPSIRIYAINMGQDKEKVVPFMEKHKWTFPVLLDSDVSVTEAYSSMEPPTAFVIGKDGVIKAVFSGYRPYGPNNTHGAIRAAITKALKTP